MTYLTNRLHFSVCVYCNRSQMTSQRVKNKKVRDEVEYLVVLYNKNSNGLLRDLGGMKEEEKSPLT